MFELFGIAAGCVELGTSWAGGAIHGARVGSRVCLLKMRAVVTHLALWPRNTFPTPSTHPRRCVALPVRCRTATHHIKLAQQCFTLSLAPAAPSSLLPASTLIKPTQLASSRVPTTYSGFMSPPLLTSPQPQRRLRSCTSYLRNTKQALELTSRALHRCSLHPTMATLALNACLRLLPSRRIAHPHSSCLKRTSARQHTLTRSVSPSTSGSRPRQGRRAAESRRSHPRRSPR